MSTLLIQLTDKTSVQVTRLIDSRARLTFLDLSRELVIPKEVEITTELLNKINAELKKNKVITKVYF